MVSIRFKIRASARVKNRVRVRGSVVFKARVGFVLLLQWRGTSFRIFYPQWTPLSDCVFTIPASALRLVSHSVCFSLCGKVYMFLDILPSMDPLSDCVFTIPASALRLVSQSVCFSFCGKVYMFLDILPSVDPLFWLCCHHPSQCPTTGISKCVLFSLWESVYKTSVLHVEKWW